MWSAVEASAVAQPTTVIALAVPGMNDVLNSQGHTQVAWWNRVPIAAWSPLVVTAICCIGWSAMVRVARTQNSSCCGLTAGRVHLAPSSSGHHSPRRGLIHAAPQNLV